MAGTVHVDYEAMARAMVMVSRYSADITELAVQSLGRGDIENRDIQFLLSVHDRGPVTPTGLAATTGADPSVVSRALRRLEEGGLVARARDAGDRRSVVVTVTGKGRRRVTGFADRLADYFASGEPLLKDMFHALGFPNPDLGGAAVVDPLVAANEMGQAGAAFIEEVTLALEPFGIREFADRFTLVLIFLHGHQRPSQVADELGFSMGGTSRLLTRLEQVGLITRRHDATEGDRRAVKLELTARGEEAVRVQLTTFAQHAPRLAAALRLTWRG
jgi:DNA-binding MarR family transcriptional regulator